MMTSPPSPGLSPPLSNPPALKADLFLGERLRILQPATGYRAGIDAVLLAASVPATHDAHTTVLDCGAGVGTVGLCVAARCPCARITLVERAPELLELARQNIVANALQDRIVAIAGDVTAPATSAEAPALATECFDHVVANPPFHDDASGTDARDPLKRASHAMPAGTLDSWGRFAARMAKPGGHVTMIHKTDALLAVLDALRDRFGALTITPIQPYAGKPAIRVLVSGIKGSRAPLSLHQPIILHDTGGAFTPYVGQILRQGASLISQTKD